MPARSSSGEQAKRRGLALDSLSVQCNYDPSGAGERSNPQFRAGGDGLFGLSPRAARQIRGRSGADSTVWMKEGEVGDTAIGLAMLMPLR